MRHVTVRGLRQILDVHEVLANPLAVGRGGGELMLDFLVFDDTASLGVHEEHAAGLDARALDDAPRLNVEHARLRCHDDEAVIRDPDASRSQSVAVEDRADDGTVRKGDGGGAVPGLHETGVVLVEVAQLRVDDVCVLPGLRDHHHDGVRQGAPAEVEKLEGLVEECRVRAGGSADGQDAIEWAELRGANEGLAGAHPVLVALDSVDLAVVRDEAERMGQRPGREGVGGKARVDERDGGFHVGVAQIGVEVGELRGGEHALVDDGARRERGKVDGVLAVLRAELAFAALAEEEHDAVELDAGRAVCSHKNLLEVGHGLAGHLAEAGGIDGDLAPTEDGRAFFAGDGLDLTFGVEHGHAAAWQEGDAGGVRAGLGEVEAVLGGDGTAEAVRDLEEDAGAVAGVGLRAGGAAVLEVDERLDALVHDVAGGAAVHVRDEGDAAGIVFVGRVI